jgi:hypothetical protein
MASRLVVYAGDILSVSNPAVPRLGRDYVVSIETRCSCTKKLEVTLLDEMKLAS